MVFELSGRRSWSVRRDLPCHVLTDAGDKHKGGPSSVLAWEGLDRRTLSDLEPVASLLCIQFPYSNRAEHTQFMASL